MGINDRHVSVRRRYIPLRLLRRKRNAERRRSKHRARDHRASDRDPERGLWLD